MEERKMRHGRIVGLVAIATFALLATGLVAQPGSGGCIHRMSYDASAEMVVEGTVEKVKAVDCCPNGPGVHLLIASGASRYEVRLGPASFVAEDEPFKVAPGDEVKITASPLPQEGEIEGLIARQVEYGDRVLKLRDEAGIPLWAGRGGRYRSR
jgi:hypothetical protein